MQLVRGCLMSLGLMLLLLITSCVVGVSGCSRIANPTEYGQTIEEAPDKTRRMVRDFLEGATYEGADALAVRGKPVIVKVQDYTDGSVHLSASQADAVLLDIAIGFKSIEADRTRVDVVVDGDALASRLNGLGAGALHRAIRDELEEAFEAIDGHRVLSRGLLLSRLIAKARGKARF